MAPTKRRPNQWKPIGMQQKIKQKEKEMRTDIKATATIET